MGSKKSETRKCRLCGREFVPRSPGDRYCPGVCAMSAGFIPSRKKSEDAGTTARRSEGTAAGMARSRAREEEKFRRVIEMFQLPIGERWAVAKTFTPEEQAYSLKIQKRMLAEMKRADYECSWSQGGGDDDEWMRRPSEDESLGDSDDGSI